MLDLRVGNATSLHLVHDPSKDVEHAVQGWDSSYHQCCQELMLKARGAYSIQGLAADLQNNSDAADYHLYAVST